MNVDDIRSPLVSICILTFNHESYIKRAIESCIEQTYENVEIIIVDNNSSDRTSLIIESEFESELKNKRLRFYKLETNTYPSHGINYGLGKANGKYICTLSGDDSFSVDKVQRQVEVMLDRKLSNLFTWVNIINDDDDIITSELLEPIFNNNYSSQEIKEKFIRDGNVLCAGSVMLDRDVFKHYGYFDERLLQLQDYDFWLRIATNENVNLLPEKLTNYRVRDDGKNLSLENSKAKFLRTEFEEIYTSKHLINFDTDTLSNVTGSACSSQNKHELLFKYYLKLNKTPKAKSILLSLYEELGSTIDFPSDKYNFFFDSYSKMDIFNSISQIDQKLKDEELARLKTIENSKIWRATGFALHQVKRVSSLSDRIKVIAERNGGFFNLAKKTYSVLKNQGISGVKQTVKAKLLSHRISKEPVNADFLYHVEKEPAQIFVEKILLIAELSIPQCEKYRVTQKKEMFESLGIQCEIVNWSDYFTAKSLISLSSLVIFYRVPGVDTVLSLIAECKRLKIRTFWEVDDLIFERDVLLASKTIQSLDKLLQNQLADGAILYKKALLECDEAIASTPGLAAAMENAGTKNVYIVENALDKETLAISKQILEAKSEPETDAIIRIVYGSGTSTHNIDFEEAAPSLAKVLSERDNVVFRIIGMLELPSYFKELESKIERIEFCKYNEYLNLISECQISIAPLEHYIFNDAKSNIKYIEASCVKVASICSPLSAFSQVIQNNKNGLLASTDNEWYQSFNELVDNVDFRKELAAAAYQSVMSRYLPQSIAKEQLRPIVANQNTDKEKKRKVVSFNVFYSPRSFGGATVVTEQINELLSQYSGYEIYAVTTIPLSNLVQAYEVVRYEVNGVTVFGIGIPERQMDSYDNPKVTSVVEKILKLIDADLAHIHCIQGLGVGVIDACKHQSLKYIVTLHDAWWICPRQFMIKSDGKYCNQYILDKKTCKKCIGSRSKYESRQSRVLPLLKDAEVLLAPSQFFTDLHNVNNISSQKVICNKNGVKFPLTFEDKQRTNKIRFGYVGGNTTIKGIHIVLEAFRGINDSRIELNIVDNLMNLGERSFSENDFHGIENYNIIPAYNQNTIDEFFKSIDVLLFPSQCKESFGLTVREAISRNVWVIATDAGGAAEDIIENVNGNIIDFNSSKSDFKNAIERYVLEYWHEYSDGKVISLQKSHISSFKNQAEQLAIIFEQVIK